MAGAATAGATTGENVVTVGAGAKNVVTGTGWVTTGENVVTGTGAAGTTGEKVTTGAGATGTTGEYVVQRRGTVTTGENVVTGVTVVTGATAGEKVVTGTGCATTGEKVVTGTGAAGGKKTVVGATNVGVATGAKACVTTRSFAVAPWAKKVESAATPTRTKAGHRMVHLLPISKSIGIGKSSPLDPNCKSKAIGARIKQLARRILQCDTGIHTISLPKQPRLQNGVKQETGIRGQFARGRICTPYFALGNAKSAMNNWLARSDVRLAVHISFLPSGEKTGSTSADGWSVIRVTGPGAIRPPTTW